MRTTLKKHHLRRLDVQGFDRVAEDRLAETAPWLRLAFGLCAVLAIGGILLASPGFLTVLAVIAALAALFPVHPFDLIYNLGIRHVTGTAALPRRGAPSRFACGVGAVWLVAVIWAFSSGATTAAYVLGILLVGIAVLVATTDICIPSMIFRRLFGAPVPRGEQVASHTDA